LINSEKNTLVILTPGFPESESDSSCLPLQQSFVRNFKAMHPQLNIVVFSFQYPFVEKTYSLFDTTVTSFNGQNKGGLARLMLRQPINKALKRIHTNSNIIGILSFWYGECALIGHRFAKQYELKHFCWLMGQDARETNKYPERALIPADELIALSDFLADEFEKNHHIRPTQVVAAGVDPSAYDKLSPVKDIDILGAGSLIPLKQFDQFIEIIAELKKEIPNIRCKLSGDGREKENLSSLVAEHHLSENIELTGELPHRDLLKLMQRSKLFLHTSSYEGFSGVCLEAMGGGAKVISFCRPMKNNMEHWHVVNTMEEMKQQAMAILQNKNTQYNPAFPYSISETVNGIANLFS